MEIALLLSGWIAGLAVGYALGKLPKKNPRYDKMRSEFDEFAQEVHESRKEILGKK